MKAYSSYKITLCHEDSIKVTFPFGEANLQTQLANILQFPVLKTSSAFCFGSMRLFPLAIVSVKDFIDCLTSSSIMFALTQEMFQKVSAPIIRMRKHDQKRSVQVRKFICNKSKCRFHLWILFEFLPAASVKEVKFNSSGSIILMRSLLVTGLLFYGFFTYKMGPVTCRRLVKVKWNRTWKVAVLGT